MNRFGYAEGDGVNGFDPLGLWAAEGPIPTPTPSQPKKCSCTKFSCSIGAYAGIGGGVAVAWENGTLEIISRIGSGVGGGLSYDPNQGVSPHSKRTGSGYIARTSVGAGGGFGVGPVSVGAGYAQRSGNAFAQPVGGGFSEVNIPTYNAEKRKPSFGASFEAYFGPEFGSYANWGSSCACPN